MDMNYKTPQPAAECKLWTLEEKKKREQKVKKKNKNKKGEVVAQASWGPVPWVNYLEDEKWERRAGAAADWSEYQTTDQRLAFERVWAAENYHTVGFAPRLFLQFMYSTSFAFEKIALVG